MSEAARTQRIPMLSGMALRPIELALNRSIAASTAARRALAALSGRAVRIDVAHWPESLRLDIRSTGISLAPAGPESCDAAIAGTPLALARLALARSAGDARTAGARLEGDLETIEGLAEVLRLARPAPLLLLADWVGDVPAYELGRLTAAVLSWRRDAQDSLERSLAEYLQEEARQVPAPLEAEALFRDIERLRDDVARAEQRLEHLGSRAR